MQQRSDGAPHLRRTRYKLNVTSYKLHVTSYKLQATSYKQQGGEDGEGGGGEGRTPGGEDQPLAAAPGAPAAQRALRQHVRGTARWRGAGGRRLTVEQAHK